MAADSDDIVEQIPSLRRYARALTGHPDRADDLVQDCLERAWRRLHQWQAGSDLRAWLFTIMHNLYVNQVRRYCAAPPCVAIDAVEYYPDMKTSAETALHVEDLDKAIAQLPDEQREVLLLIALEGMTYAQVAAILGIPIGTVMSRLHRARERLRGWLDGDQSCGLRRVK